MNIAHNQGIDGLTVLKRLKTTVIFSGNRELAEGIESAIKKANGYNYYLSELMKLNEPMRKNVNRNLVKSLESIDEGLRTPQFNLVFTQLKQDTM